MNSTFAGSGGEYLDADLEEQHDILRRALRELLTLLADRRPDAAAAHVLDL
eukprot:COSAG06_NODE_2899_length_6118_cov_9.580495_3_plen_51_part_00